MLAIGRALMQEPELLLLDEPIEGLAPLVVMHLGEALRHIREAGVTILLADQNVKFCRKVAVGVTSWRRAWSSSRGPWPPSGRTRPSSASTWQRSIRAAEFEVCICQVKQLAINGCPVPIFKNAY